MPRPIYLSPKVPCDMVRNCPRAWVVFEARRKGVFVEEKRSCRQHATTAISYMHTLPDVKVTVRIVQ